jgi:hypothetical protein
MRKTNRLLIVSYGLFIHSCSGFINEEHLGNNFRLSEYDNIDRRILYSEEKCSGSGIEIVPMTVTAYAKDSKWIIAKSQISQFGRKYQYWIIDKDFKFDVATKADSSNTFLKSHVLGPLDSASFAQIVNANKIHLTLKKI